MAEEVRMKRNTALALVWSPRVFGLAFAVFLSLFALDSFGEGKGLARSLADFAVHLTPAGLVLLLVALSRRWPWISGLASLAMAAIYAWAAHRHPTWVLAISGPLLLLGGLFLLGWRAARAPVDS